MKRLENTPEKPLKPKSPKWEWEEFYLGKFLTTVRAIETPIKDNEVNFDYIGKFQDIDKIVSNYFLSFSAENMELIEQTLISLQAKYQEHLKRNEALLKSMGRSKESECEHLLQCCIENIQMGEKLKLNFRTDDNPEDNTKITQPGATLSQFFKPETTPKVDDTVPASAQASTAPAQSLQQASSTLPTTSQGNNCHVLWACSPSTSTSQAVHGSVLFDCSTTTK